MADYEHDYEHEHEHDDDDDDEEDEDDENEWSPYAKWNHAWLREYDHPLRRRSAS